eukprot:g6325.t1
MADEDKVFKLKVKNIIGRYKQYDVRPSQSVRRLKEQICEVEGINAEQIRIVMKGKQLKDEKSLRECKVSAKAKVSIVLSLRGGFA